ncbi:MAG: metal ABC transporter substrate-binding protein [Myxococcaceae bacterium]|nr:metal ABC transporter substrate-binding protein [Myxococcaceae bacterium]MCI0671802.1 metal ABC transporter substrate-binding protein [Myxococcaceae bacterium]
MIRFFALLPVLLLSLPARADLRVAATVPDLAAIAREVGGSAVTVTALSLPTQDPHFVDARPSLALELSRANLVLAVGLELEVGWLPNLIVGSRNAAIQRGSRGYFEVARLVKLKDVPQERLDRSMGDVHPGGNPHFLFDLRNAVPVAAGIAERLRELDPQNAALYTKNLAAFTAKVEQARQQYEKRLAWLKGEPILGYHMSLTYLADWLGTPLAGYLEPKPGIPPSPSHAAAVLSQARARKVRFVVQEEFYPDTISKVVAERLPARLVILPGGTRFREGQTYLQHIEDFVKAFEKAHATGGAP